MKRFAQIALVAILAFLVSSAALSFPQKAWAAGHLGQVNVISDAENIGMATWGYSGRSWTTFGGLVGQALTLLPSSSVQQVDNSLPDKNKTDSISKIAESEATVKEIFLTSQFLVSESTLVELQWNESSPSAVLELTHKLLAKLGNENDVPTADSVFGRVVFLDETWSWQSARETKGQVLAIRENLLSLQNEVELTGLTVQAFEKLAAVNTKFEELEALVGVPGDGSISTTLFGQLSQTKSEKLNDSVEEPKRLGDFTTTTEHSSWS